MLGFAVTGYPALTGPPRDALDEKTLLPGSEIRLESLPGVLSDTELSIGPLLADLFGAERYRGVLRGFT